MVKNKVTVPGTSAVVERYSNSGKLSGNIKFLVPPKYLENAGKGLVVVVRGMTAGLDIAPDLNINRDATAVAPITDAPLIAYCPAGKLSSNESWYVVHSFAVLFPLTVAVAVCVNGGAFLIS